MEDDLTEDLSKSFEAYQHSLRGRASDSLNELQQLLSSTPSVSPEQKQKYRKSPGKMVRKPQPSAWQAYGNTEHSDYTYGAAVDRLRTMLTNTEPKKSPKIVQFSPRSRGAASDDSSVAYGYPSPRVPWGGAAAPPLQWGGLPSQEETMALLQNQSGLVQQLDLENQYNKDELHVLKVKVREVIEENRLLHEELKRTTIEEILKEGLDVTEVPSAVPGESEVRTPRVQEAGMPLTKHDYGKWQRELERLNSLHAAKTSRLEAQLQHAREEVDKSTHEVDDLRAKVRALESLQNVDPEIAGLAAGLCIRCAHNEAVLPPSVGASQKQSLARVTKERDALMEQLSALTGRYEQLKLREEEMYLQVKRSVQMVECAQLEQTQILVQKEQLRDELRGMRQRLGDHVEEVQVKMAEDRQLTRHESEAERAELKAQIKELTETLVGCQTQLERASRDKVSLMAELEAARGAISCCDVDYGKATDNMKISMTTANIERGEAVTVAKKLKDEMASLERDREQERSRLRQELLDLRRRLSVAERDLVEAKEQCIHLTDSNQALERETHLARLAKETVEKNRSGDLKNFSKRAEQREAELNLMIDTLEHRYNHSQTELENILNSQGGLVQKLQLECRRLTKQLEDSTHRYKTDNKKLKSQNDALRMRLEKNLRRVRELEDQQMQHGLLQEKMRERLKQMDSHSQHSSQQVLELLARESALMRDRLLLAKEIEFLRHQVTDQTEAQMNKHFSTQRTLVDDILVDVNSERESEIRKKTVDAARRKTANAVKGHAVQTGQVSPLGGNAGSISTDVSSPDLDEELGSI